MKEQQEKITEQLVKQGIEYYKANAVTPTNALKKIEAGRIKGASDINPQWRYERMTETFGLCGVGWYYEITETIFKEVGKETVVFINLLLYVKVDGEWSKGIPANGGNFFIKTERNGEYVNDEAIKMATTDALGTAMKMVGIAADVYRGIHDTKYSANNSKPLTPQPPVKQEVAKVKAETLAALFVALEDKLITEEERQATLQIIQNKSVELSENKAQSLLKRLNELIEERSKEL